MDNPVKKLGKNGSSDIYPEDGMGSENMYNEYNYSEERGENDMQDEGDDDDEDDDEYEEDPRQMIVEMGAHKRMQRIQKVLFNQLTENNERVGLELREKEEEAKRLRAKREEIGVSLYGVQQQLAKVQLSLETTHSKYNEINEERFQTEESVDSAKGQYTKLKAMINDEKKQLLKNQAELDALNATLRQVEKYNEEMQSEINVTRRTAYKTEENVSSLEKSKKEQDLYIDTLTEELKSLREQAALAKSQLQSQKEETLAAEETLKDASQEMENISFEKKQLFQQWKSSLIGMQRRDEAMQATQAAIHEIRESILSVKSEIQGFMKSTSKAEELNETLTGTVDRIDADIQFTEEQFHQLVGEKDRLSERYGMLQKSMKQTDVETQRANTELKSMETDLGVVQKQIENVRRDRFAVENEITAQKNTHTTASKAVLNLQKEEQKIQNTIHEKETTVVNMKNELARIKVDKLNTSAHNSQLGETMQKIVHDLKEKDALVERMELEVRQRNDEIEKKMLRVDRLNRKYEALTSKMEDENTGPLEATIKNLKKEIATIQKDNTERQREWLDVQTALVNSTAETEEISERNQELKSKISILQQKRLRLVNNIEHMKQDVKGLKSGVTGMHKDIVKLNELISKNTVKQKDLNEGNFGLEMEFVRELKEMEEESIQAEQQIATLKMEKQELLDEIVETERQIMLWEKKIQLEKETQAALDPEVGQAEARAMEKEIHRMKLRYETLQRDQERMTNEMERAILKRDSIALRGKGRKDSGYTQASIKKRLSSLQHTMKKSRNDVGKYEIAIKEKMDMLDNIGYTVEKHTNEYNQLEERTNNLQKQINVGLYDKQRYIDAVVRKQRLAKRFQDLSGGKIKMIEKDDVERVKQDHMKITMNLEKVRSIVFQFQGEHPHLKEVLERVMLLTQDL